MLPWACPGGSSYCHPTHVRTPSTHCTRACRTKQVCGVMYGVHHPENLVKSHEVSELRDCMEPVPCLTTAIWRCRKNSNQWQHSFQWKLYSHWLKFLRQRHVAVVRQGPGEQIIHLTGSSSEAAFKLYCDRKMKWASLEEFAKSWCQSYGTVSI